MRVHLKVFVIAALYGLGAYAAIRALLYLSSISGVLEFLPGFGR